MSPAAEAAAAAEPESAPADQPKRRSEWPYVIGGVLVASAIVFAGLIAAVVISFDSWD